MALVSINVWRLAGDTLNVTCNFLCCNHQVHRDFLITLCIISIVDINSLPVQAGPVKNKWWTGLNWVSSLAITMETGSIPGQQVCDLWWKKWHYDSSSYQTFDSSLSLSFQCLVHVRYYVTDNIYWHYLSN
jgi:hypothetical protein